MQAGSMTELEGSARGVSLRAAASMVAGDEHDPIAGRRLRHAVDAQLRRAGIAAQDAGDVRTEVVLALLSAPAGELPLPLELVCARVSAIARNKAIDCVRRGARAPLALGDDLPEPRSRRPSPARSRTASTTSRPRRTCGGCAPTSSRRSAASTRRSAPPSRRTPGAGPRAPPACRARPTTARSATRRRCCRAIYAGASPASARSGASPSARARSSPTSRPSTRPQPRRPRPSRSAPRSCSPCTTRPRITSHRPARSSRAWAAASSRRRSSLPTRARCGSARPSPPRRPAGERGAARAGREAVPHIQLVRPVHLRLLTDPRHHMRSIPALLAALFVLAIAGPAAAGTFIVPFGNGSSMGARGLEQQGRRRRALRLRGQLAPCS